MKEIKDYLQFYLGCNVHRREYSKSRKLTASLLSGLLEDETGNCYGYKPALRPLSDMTQDEKYEVEREWRKVAESADNTTYQADAAQTKYLLSKHFDLFGLIEANLAIDATTLTQP